jgi:hypothetical protein
MSLEYLGCHQAQALLHCQRLVTESGAGDTAICKIIGNRSTDFNGFFVPVYYWKNVENCGSIPKYFAIPSTVG